MNMYYNTWIWYRSDSVKYNTPLVFTIGQSRSQSPRSFWPKGTRVLATSLTMICVLNYKDKIFRMQFNLVPMVLSPLPANKTLGTRLNISSNISLPYKIFVMLCRLHQVFLSLHLINLDLFVTIWKIKP